MFGRSLASAFGWDARPTGVVRPPPRLDNAAAQRERVRDADRRLADIGLPPVGSRITVDWGGGPSGEATLHDLTQDGKRASVSWDHLPGTSLVHVAFLGQSE